jgi:hypothetical protein
MGAAASIHVVDTNTLTALTMISTAPGHTLLKVTLVRRSVLTGVWFALKALTMDSAVFGLAPPWILLR